MTIDEELKNCFQGLKMGGRQPQLRWCEAQSINKEDKEMQALGEMDNLEYYGVKLGMNGHTIYPKVGSRCLVAIVEGQETDAFLLYAEEVELIATNATDIVFNMGELGGLVKVEALTQQLNAIEDDINELKRILSSWSPIQNDGGMALKSILSGYTRKKVAKTTKKQLENQHIRQ